MLFFGEARGLDQQFEEDGNIEGQKWPHSSVWGLFMLAT